MGIYFGTDGIRGVVNDRLTFSLGYKCGNALCALKNKPKILIGRDSRITGDFLTLAVGGGVLAGGGDVFDIGVCSTPAIAYLTKHLKCDYGVVISASHNPPEYNGIKIFDCKGIKLGDKREDDVERKFVSELNVRSLDIGRFYQKNNFLKYYLNFLCSNCGVSLKGLTIVLDGSNGGVYSIAPQVFRKLGARVIATNCHNKGELINKNCGALYPQKLSKCVKQYGADVGFSFDGDGDRIIAVDENGDILDGDNIVYVLAKYFKNLGILKGNTVVGTRHTNVAIEEKLKEYNISMIRTDIGDKYVCAKMEELHLSLGGEKSGHVILGDILMTGDGVLTAIKLAEIIKVTGKKLSQLNDVCLYPQVNIDCEVEDKVRIINSEKLSQVVGREEKLLGNGYRIMVRISGTENKIRIMVEGIDEGRAVRSAKEIQRVVDEINKNF